MIHKRQRPPRFMPSARKRTVSLTKLQAYITENYYTCTYEILACLGEVYVADDRFKKNIDKYGGGTAEFAAEAIAVYCRKESSWHSN